MVELKQHSNEMRQKIREVVSEAIDEVYPDMLPEQKALALIILRERIREDIEELFQLLEEGNSIEMLKTLILTSYTKPRLE
jgi:hypothetical protein